MTTTEKLLCNVLRLIETRGELQRFYDKITGLEAWDEDAAQASTEEPFMWWCKCAAEDRDLYFGDEGDFVTESRGDADEAEENGFTVTPLYRHPPIAPHGNAR